MTSTPEFRGAVHQNLYLAEGGQEVHAVITVDTETGRGEGSAPDSSGPAAAEVLILDCSGSMGHPPEKIVKAKEAAAVAIDELRDGVPFALVAGSSGARMLWPGEPTLMPADEQTRDAARTALRRLSADGGTTIGAWLRLAGQLLGHRREAIRHAILLTDGRNEHESPEDLAAAVADCTGQFSCDCRGVGTDWSVAELRTIASALLGTVGLVAEPADLADDFRTMMATSMRKGVGEVGLRLWTPVGAAVRFVKQAAPTLEDLTSRRVGSDPQTGDYPTGSWGAESRDYHICIEIEPGHVGEEKLACRAMFVHPGADGTPPQPLGQAFSHTEPDGSTSVHPSALVRAFWTDDLARATTFNDKVAAVTGRAELARAVQDGLEAHRCGDDGRAVDHLRRARGLAEQCQDASVLGWLDQIYDPDSGTIGLHKMSAREGMELDIESTRTTPLRRG
ncbi:MAG: VWA domain-containing protein [Actinomycetota bacterium]|nr:VWA domain-containing protein [Actinomycetota bacterium]